jgi:hypothetical protein
MAETLPQPSVRSCEVAGLEPFVEIADGLAVPPRLQLAPEAEDIVDIGLDGEADRFIKRPFGHPARLVHVALLQVG